MANRRSRKINRVSVITPCYNEEGNVRAFVARIDAVMKELKQPYELIIVDDGSSDGSVLEITEQMRHCTSLRCLSLSRNFGQQAALLAGIHHASGEVLITLDLDLQQPPEVIPALLEKWWEGAKIVHAIPVYKRSATWFKKLTSKLFYRFLQFLGGPRVVYKSNDFRLFDRKVADIICRLPEKNLYLRGLFSWLGFDQAKVEYIHRRRHSGDTKFSLAKMIALALRGTTSQSIRPLRIGLVIGFSSILGALALIVYALYVHLMLHQTVSGWTSVMVALLFFSSIQFMLLGIVGEYVGQVFREVKGRPVYVVEELYHGVNKSFSSGGNDEIISIGEIGQNIKQSLHAFSSTAAIGDGGRAF